jgi:hypothetical protein
MSLEVYKSLLLLQRCRWSAGTLHVRSLRLKFEPEAPIWQSMTVRGLGIWSALPPPTGTLGTPAPVPPARIMGRAFCSDLRVSDASRTADMGGPCPDVSTVIWGAASGYPGEAKNSSAMLSGSRNERPEP